MVTLAAFGERLEPVREDHLCGLIEAIAQRHDKSAFARLFTFYGPKLKAYIMTGGMDSETAEEVAQETMLAVWRRAATFDRSIAPASAWVFAIARNKQIDRVRRDKRPDFSAELAYFRSTAPPTPDEQIIQQRRAESLRDLILELPEEQLDILKKAFFEGKSHSAISAELKLPLGTVKSRVRLALARLRVQATEAAL